MTFHDLPEQWDRTDLTDPTRAADVVDLFLGLDDRHHNCLLILLCDEDHKLLQPICIEGVDWRCSEEERRTTFEYLTLHFDLPFIVAISSWRSVPDEAARAWRRSAEEAVRNGAGELMHFYAVTSREVTLVPPETVRV